MKTLLSIIAYPVNSNDWMDTKAELVFTEDDYQSRVTATLAEIGSSAFSVIVSVLHSSAVNFGYHAGRITCEQDGADVIDIELGTDGNGDSYIVKNFALTTVQIKDGEAPFPVSRSEEDRTSRYPVELRQAFRQMWTDFGTYLNPPEE